MRAALMLRCYSGRVNPSLNGGAQMDDEEQVQPSLADLETTVEDLDVEDDASERVTGGESFSLNFTKIEQTYTPQGPG
jgi:hypothetical protein